MYSFSLDYKFNGKLVIFELGNTFHGDQEIVKKFYGLPATEQILLEAKEYANKKGIKLHSDYNQKESFSLEFYASEKSEGLIISHDPTMNKFNIFESKKKIICNSHIASLLDVKWLFNYFCLNNASLAEYNPKTFFATQATLSEISQTLPEGEYYIKSSNGSRGRGIQILDKKNIDAKKILPVFAADPLQTTANMLNKFFPEHYLFLIQEKITGDIIQQKNSDKYHERTRRVYVTIYGDINDPENFEIKLTHAYFRIPKKSDNKKPGCEYPENKHFYKFTPSTAEEQEIKKFARLFLTALYDKSCKRFPKQWENMISNFLNEFSNKDNKYRKNDRTLKIAQIGHALVQEQEDSFERISDFHASKLTAFYNLLTHEEKSFFNIYLFNFFIYTIIGRQERPIPQNYVNSNLVSLFAIFVANLSNEAEQETVPAFVKMVAKQAASSASPMHHNLRLLQELVKICDEKILPSKLDCLTVKEQFDGEANYHPSM